MLQQLSDFNSWFNGIAWGLPLIALLVGGGLILMFFSRLLPFTGFTHALRLTLGKYHHPGDSNDPGQLTHFKALCNALAATVGLGNIGGVAIALSTGGPGAIFWMWLAAIIGMNTKFFECTLAVMYRGKDHTGQVQGGPMYVIDNALPHWLKPLAVFFAICGLVGTTAMYTANETTKFIHTSWLGMTKETTVLWMDMPIDKLLIGAMLAALVTYVLSGGIKRLARWTCSLVPIMCFFYTLAALSVIALNFDAVPEAFASIFIKAFSPDAVIGGAQGTIVMVLITGIKRAAFSNEAGIGTAPMAHSNAKTTEPISEGLVAMLGPLIDTLIVCTMTALVILVTLTPDDYVGRTGVVITSQAFSNTFGGWGTHGLGVAVLLFGFSTMIGMANYNLKCWDYLFRGRFGRGPFLLWFAFTLVLGAAASHKNVITLIDSAYALMAIPTMTSTLILAPKVTKALRAYKQKYFGKASPPPSI